MGLQAPKERRLIRSLAAIPLGRLPAGRAGRQGEGDDGTGAHMGMRAPKEREAHSVRMVRSSFGTALRPGSRAKEREADQVACRNLSGTPPGWEGREARRGRRSECLGSSLLAPFDTANNIPWLTYRQYRAAFFFTLVNSSCSLHNPTLLVGILLKKEGSRFFPTAFGLHPIILCFANPTRHYCT